MNQKPLIFALLAVALAGGGAAFYLLKYKPDQDKAARIAAAQLIIEDETPAPKSAPAKVDPTPEVKPEPPAVAAEPTPSPAPAVTKAEPPVFVKPEPKAPSESSPEADPKTTASTGAAVPPTTADSPVPKPVTTGNEVSPAVKTTPDGKSVLAFPDSKSATPTTAAAAASTAETKEPVAGTPPATANPPTATAPQPALAENKDQAPRTASSPIRKIGLDGKPLVAIPDPRATTVHSTTVSPLRKVGADGKPVVSLPDPRELNKPKEPATQP